jgi:hypothetical protein
MRRFGPHGASRVRSPPDKIGLPGDEHSWPLRAFPRTGDPCQRGVRPRPTAKCHAACAECTHQPALRDTLARTRSRSGMVPRSRMVSHCGTVAVPQWHSTELRHGIAQRHGVPYGTVSRSGTVSTPVSHWHCGLVSHGSMVSFGMGSIVVDTYEAALPNEAARATDVAGNVPCEPTDATCSCSSCNRSSCDNDQMRTRTGSTARDDDPVNGAHAEASAEENCTAAEEAGLPSASESATSTSLQVERAQAWRGSESAMPHCAFPCGSATKSQSTGTSDGADSSAQEAESCAPCDDSEESDNRRDY